MGMLEYFLSPMKADLLPTDGVIRTLHPPGYGPECSETVSWVIKMASGPQKHVPLI